MSSPAGSGPNDRAHISGPTNWNWPNGAKVAVSFTFDVDGESPYLGGGAKYENLLTSMSDGLFGITRGLPRILNYLRTINLPCTFYVPGEIARLYPHSVGAILNDGHEVGHHGHLRKPVHLLSDAEQEEEMVLGLNALASIGVSHPSGYRSPSWEVTPTTFRLICGAGFDYDSSFMGDDRPYIERYGEQSLLALPVSWTLDDWPLLGWSPHSQCAKLASPDVYLSSWLSEYREARAEGRHVSFTMHPEVIGRSLRFAAFRQLIETVAADGGVWIATMRDVAQHVAPLLKQPKAEQA